MACSLRPEFHCDCAEQPFSATSKLREHVTKALVGLDIGCCLLQLSESSWGPDVLGSWGRALQLLWSSDINGYWHMPENQHCRYVPQVRVTADVDRKRKEQAIGHLESEAKQLTYHFIRMVW